MMCKYSTKVGTCTLRRATGFANNRYRVMHTNWSLWVGMLGALLVSGAGMASWCFPGWWRRVWPRGRRVRTTLVGDLGSVLRHGARRPSRSAVVWGMSAAMLVLLPAAMVWVWSRWSPQRLDGFDERVEPANAQVAQLLAGEQLVPPPPLPPDVFLAADIAAEQPLLATADRRWSQMDAQFVQSVLQVFRVMKAEHGYDMALLEGWRSPQRQALLAEQGPTVTRAGPWQSYHQWGLAADCAFLRDGRLVISERDPWARQGYALFGQVAEQMGLTWGGRWKMADLGHVEWRKPGVQAAMRQMGR